MPHISVILVKPLYAGNVGSAARAMANFGFKNLILVNPCKLTKEASDMAVHAKPIMEKAKICKDFESAIKNFNLIVGTTSESTNKDYNFLRICITPEQLREKVSHVKGKVALVFGPEDIGLTNEELERCDIVVSIPTAAEYKSMNLSHSVAILLYELSKAESLIQSRAQARDGRRPNPESPIRLASKKEKDLISENFVSIANLINYPKPAERRKIFNLMLTKIIGRAQVTGREANTLIGVLRRIKRKLKYV